jgi:hypothetical protein
MQHSKSGGGQVDVAAERKGSQTVQALVSLAVRFWRWWVLVRYQVQGVCVLFVALEGLYR